MQLKAGYGSMLGLPCDEGKSPTWLTCKRAHAGRLDWGLKTSITFVWLSIYQYTDFHFSSPAEFPAHEPPLCVAHLYLWCARCWNTSSSLFSVIYCIFTGCSWDGAIRPVFHTAEPFAWWALNIILISTARIPPNSSIQLLFKLSLTSAAH